jgi:hypothetical protein
MLASVAVSSIFWRKAIVEFAPFAGPCLKLLAFCDKNHQNIKNTMAYDNLASRDTLWPSVKSR